MSGERKDFHKKHYWCKRKRQGNRASTLYMEMSGDGDSTRFLIMFPWSCYYFFPNFCAQTPQGDPALSFYHAITFPLCLVSLEVEMSLCVIRRYGRYRPRVHLKAKWLQPPPSRNPGAMASVLIRAGVNAFARICAVITEHLVGSEASVATWHLKSIST